MDEDKKTQTNCCFWFVALAQGMVFIDLLCRSPINLLIKNNPITILPFLLITYDVFPGLLTGVFLFLSAQYYQKAPIRCKFLSGIFTICINIVILAVAFYTFKLEIFRHPLIFVMISFGIVTLIISGKKKRMDKTNESA